MKKLDSRIALKIQNYLILQFLHEHFGKYICINLNVRWFYKNSLLNRRLAFEEYWSPKLLVVIRSKVEIAYSKIGYNKILIITNKSESPVGFPL